MENREEHVGQMETQLKQWGKKLDELTAKAENVGTEAKGDYRKGIDDLKAKYRVTQSKLAEFKTGSSENWDTFKTGIENAWSELEEAFKKITNQ